jgi:paraquat-inducible protein B
MSRRADPFAIGLFTLGGLGLAVVAILLFGSDTLFQQKLYYVSYFKDSVGGLNVGAEVSFRGVKIGEVTDIRLEMDVKTHNALIPVRYYVDRSKIHYFNGTSADVTTQDLIARGLRAQLMLVSFVTGQAAVNLDFRPEVPIVLASNPPDDSEIPVMTSELEAVKEKLTQLPVEEIAEKALKTLNDIDNLVTGPDTREILSSLASMSGQLDTATKEDLRPLLHSLKPLVDRLSETLAELRTSLNHLTGTADATTDTLHHLDPSLQALLQDADRAVRDGQAGLKGLSSLLGSDRPARADLDETLRNLALSARALRDLTDELRRNPSMLITGK